MLYDGKIFTAYFLHIIIQKSNYWKNYYTQKHNSEKKSKY